MIWFFSTISQTWILIKSQNALRKTKITKAEKGGRRMKIGVGCVRVRLGLNVVCDYVFVTHMHYVSYNQTNFIIKILLITQKRFRTQTKTIRHAALTTDDTSTLTTNHASLTYLKSKNHWYFHSPPQTSWPSPSSIVVTDLHLQYVCALLLGGY